MSFSAVVSKLKHPLVIVTGTAVAVMLTFHPGNLPAQLAAPQTLPLAARTKGAATAPVTVYEMADFQCPVCRRFFNEVWPVLNRDYVATGKVRWIFINFPLPSIHANAVAAAEFAVCAGKEGRFWQAHDMLYSTQDNWEALKDPAPFFQSKFAALGLKAEPMNSCLQSGAGTAMVRDDATGAARAGAGSTPSFYIEGGMMAGLYPLDVFRKVLDSVYAAKKKS